MDSTVRQDRRIVLITGASRGIGAEAAAQFGAAGAHVIVNFREKRKRAQDVVDAIVATGGSASVLGADVSDPAAVETMVAEVIDGAPKHVVSIDTIGRAPNGKVDYKRLKQYAIDELG